VARAARLPKRVLRRRLRSALLRYARAEPPEGGDPGRKVFIPLVSAWGMGGTIRAAINLAGYLSSHHEVEIISTYRRREEPYFAFDPRVKVTALDDERPGATPRHLRPLRWVLKKVPSAIYPAADIRKHNHSLWTDIRLLRLVRGQRGIVIASRPGLNMLFADLELPGLLTIGLEQMNLRSHAKNLRRGMLRSYPDLDGLVVLTEEDREDYRQALDGKAPPMWRIPNTVRDIEPPQADLSAKRILAAGRYTSQKGYDMLIPAFKPVADAFPDWELKLCGRGVWTQKLTDLVEELGLQERVILAGPTEDVPGEMAQASIYALSSRYEGFPLVLIEAMSKGMAVVAFDCPTGPADIVADHENGILVPPKDVEALSRGLMEMVADEELRRRCGAAAVDAARDYTMAAIGPRWDEVLQELLQRRAA
jgi:glycosyltransferase involved in cell wall biosynthesis